MDLNEAINLKNVAELAIELEAAKDEKKKDMKAHNDAIKSIEKRLIQAAIETNNSQLKLDI